MVYSKIKKISFILLCCIVIIFPFWCVRGLCAEVEVLSTSTASGIIINANGNYFISASGSTFYVKMEKGYKYHIVIGDEVPTERRIAICTEVPALNVSYDYLGSYSPGTTFDYIPSNDSYFLCSSPTNPNVTFTREKLESQEGAINDLVSNVGVNSIWGIFENAIDYIWVVVLVAFGIFIISIIIRKLSKGKGGM